MALATATVVFTGGMVVLPPIESPPPPVVTPPPPPVVAPPAAPVATADGAGLAEAGAAGQAAADNAADDEAEASAPTVAVEPAANTADHAARAPAGTRGKSGDKTGDKSAEVTPAVDKKGIDKPTDRDAAREAWRKNMPDVSEDDTKGTILIPIKGSIEGASYHVTSKPRGVILNLPKADTLVTMRFYKLKRGGFKQLWIKQEDAGGTSLKVVLGDATDPQVELKDDYVRITVRRLPEGQGQAADPTE